MLGRYQMKRGARADELPRGIRQDTRKHTRHPLRPTPELVAAYLARPDAEAFLHFAARYSDLLHTRFAAERARFDALAALATTDDVWLGCSCPTRQNPDVRRCHTTLALEFMKRAYPALHVDLPTG